jgi:hypothetical protein
MNQRIDRTGPSVGHHGTVGGHRGTAGASPRFNAAAAFRALLGMVRSQQGTLTDKKARRSSATAGAHGRGGSHAGVETDVAVEAASSNQGGGGKNGQRRGTLTDKNARRGSSSAGGAHGHGGSHAGVETDEAVEASSSNQGGADNNGQRRAPPGGGGTSEAAAPKSSLLFAAMSARDAARSSPASEPTSSQPLVWPPAKLPGAWQRVDSATSAYVPASAFVDRISTPARSPQCYTPWNPLLGGDPVLPAAARRWGRAASVVPYASPLASTAPRVGGKQYRPFTPLRRPAAGAVSTASQRLRPGSWFRAATIRPFVSPVIFRKPPIQRVKYRPFTRLSLVAGTGSATPDKFKPGHRPRAATIPPYRSPAIVVAPQTKRSRMRSYTPPDRLDGINVAGLQKRGAGEMRLPMSIDTLVSQFQLNVGARPTGQPRPVGHRGG